MPFPPALLLTFALAASAATPDPTLVHAGEPALAFSLPAVNEQAALDALRHSRVALSDFTGVGAPSPRKAVVLHFFDGRPTADLESLARIQKRYDGKGVQVVAIIADAGSVGDLADYVNGLKLAYPVLRDSHGVVSSRYGIVDPPLTFIIDGDGAVFAVGRPDATVFEDEVAKELNALVK